jgi:hypothetical protein
MQRRKMTKERINAMCKDLNAHNYTNIGQVMTRHKMGKHCPVYLQQAGIIWKKNSYWRGMERIHDERLSKFQEYQSNYFTPSQPTLFTKTKVKVEPRKVTPRKKPTLGIVQRLKVLFTGKL